MVLKYYIITDVGRHFKYTNTLHNIYLLSMKHPSVIDLKSKTVDTLINFN